MSKATRLTSQAVLSQGINIKGVIQVGASDGPEIPLFRVLGADKALLIDPIPLHAEKLREATANIENYEVLEGVLGNVTGSVPFNVIAKRNEQQTHSSLLDPTPANNRMWGLQQPKQVSVNSWRLDDLTSPTSRFGREGDYNMMFMDAQGAELIVLENGVNWLKNSCDLLCTEIHCMDLYDGVATHDKLYEFMTGLGFELLDKAKIIIKKKLVGYDVVYVRSGSV